MAEFEIKVTELEAGGKEYSFPLRSAWLADELQALGDAGFGLVAPAEDGSVDVVADLAAGDVVIRGTVKGALVAECSRCLGPARIVVNAPLAVLLTARGNGVRDIVDSDDLSPDEMDKEFFTGDVIDLAGLVREHLFLEIPMQPLCRQDCPGLPAQHAAIAAAVVEPERGIDPRLAPLASIKLGAKDPIRLDSAEPVATKKRSKRSH